MITIIITTGNLWTEKSIDYNSTILQQAIKNKEIADKRKDYNEIDKWDKVVNFCEKFNQKGGYKMKMKRYSDLRIRITDEVEGGSEGYIEEQSVTAILLYEILKRLDIIIKQEYKIKKVE